MNNHYHTPGYINPRWKVNDSFNISRKKVGIFGCGNSGIAGHEGGWNSKGVRFSGQWNSSKGSCHCGGKKSWRGRCKCRNGCGLKKNNGCHCGERNSSSCHCKGKKSYSSGCNCAGSCHCGGGGGDGGYFSSNQNSSSCKCGDDAKSECSGDCMCQNAYEPNAPVTVYTPPAAACTAPVATCTTPVTAYSTQESCQVADGDCVCYRKIMRLAMVVMIFSNPLLGILAYYLAYKAKAMHENGMVHQSRRYIHYSWLASIIGIIATCLIFVILILVHRFTNVFSSW